MSVHVHGFDKERCARCESNESRGGLPEGPAVLGLSEQCRAGEVDGAHAGFPCGSFSMVRHRPGGPPPVRNMEFMYGLPGNSPAQQAEADKGSTLAIRSVVVIGEVIQSHARGGND